MRIHTTAVSLAIVALLALPTGALAGGWATVGLSSTPDGLAAGAAWNVELEILQHGRTPLDHVKPSVTISAGDVRRTFAARPAGRPGIYGAAVTFPHAGSWHYVVDDGFTARHPYPAVDITNGGGGVRVAASGPASNSDGDDGGGLALGRTGLAALAGLAAAAAVLLLPPARRASASPDAGPAARRGG